MRFALALHTDDGANHQANPDLAGAVWVVIDVDVEQYLGRADQASQSEQL